MIETPQVFPINIFFIIDKKKIQTMCISKQDKS